MAILIATIVLWVGALARVYVTIRRPDPARISLTAAAVCVALAFTVGAYAAGFDARLGWPNGAELVQHVLFAAAAVLTLIFLRLLRSETLPGRIAVAHVVVFVGVVIAMMALFAAAPVHDRHSTNFAVDFSDSFAAVAYRVIFSAYLVCCLVLIARTCFRHAFTAGDRSRSISLLGIGAGSAAASVAAAVGAVDMLVRFGTQSEPTLLRLINAVAIAVAGVLLGLGLLAPLPIDAYLRWRRARNTCVRLDSLWSGLTHAVPDVVLPVEQGPSPLVRVELVSARRRIEIADALSRIRVDDRHATMIRQSEDPPAALGRVLKDASSWGTSGTGVVAAELLHVRSSEDELRQILAVAGAYGADS